jgi:AcrR family transcriptional regulator
MQLRGDRTVPKTPTKRRTRAPGATRERLLLAAFHEIHLQGFQAASLETILERAGVTKGALYHHFPDKAALGIAVLEEVIKRFLVTRWEGSEVADPLSAFQRRLRERIDEVTAEEVELGCPLNNLTQEMSPLDERFRRRISEIYDMWIDGMSDGLRQGQVNGTVRQDLDPRKVAGFLVAAVEGAYGVAKGAKSVTLFRQNLELLIGYLDGLRAPAS